jgi:hypothetical protein
MRALAITSLALCFVYACGDDEAPGSSALGGEAGEAGDAGSDTGGGADGGAGPLGGATSDAVAGAAGAQSGTGAAGGNAAAGEASAGAAGSGSAVESVGIVSEATHFADYGKLRIGFDRAVEGATLTITLSPSVPAQLSVTSTTPIDDTTVEATLAYYHLPRDYQLSVTGTLPDGSPFEAYAELSGLNNGARVAFLSQQTGSGALTSWPGVPEGATPLEAADSVCQREADAAGLRGTFQAFLSIYDSVDAGCRALGLDATIADNCGEASMPVDHAPFLSMDGRPIVEGATGIIADAWAIPIPFHADGSAAAPFYTWTGSISGAKGFNNADCNGWALSASNGLPSRQIGERLVEYEFGTACTTASALLCLQTTGTFFGPSDLHHDGVKRAFVSKGKLFGTMSFDGKSGVAAADALCQSEASAESLDNADQFRAYLATADSDALCYILGQTGKVADHCGLLALPDTDPWRRVDDYPIGTAAQLASGTLTAPLALAADGTLMTKERPRTGTMLDGSTTLNCDDWSGTASYSISGHPGFITGHFTSHWTTDCDGEETSVYCFEK